MTRSARISVPLPILSVFFLLLICSFAVVDSPVVSPLRGASSPKKLKPADRYALIFGTVWGPDDHPLYGVKVNIRRARDKKPRWQLISNHTGEFAQRVPAGKADYLISADLKGLKTRDGHSLHLAQEATVHVEYDERVDTGLHLTAQ